MTAQPGRNPHATKSAPRRTARATLTRMSEFTNFDAEKSETWTLPMAAAWFIWRSYEAVQDQWKVATGEWKPASDPPSPILAMTRRHPGMLACVFNQAGFDNGGSWDDP